LTADSDPLSDEESFKAARDEVLSALNDDLNTPQMVGLLNRHNSFKLWREFDPILGLNIEARSRRDDGELPVEVQALVDERNQARKSKNWALSDDIRNKLIDMGYVVGDSPTGTTVKKKLL
jgi:cysteinyl-tRNA synthetase